MTLDAVGEIFPGTGNAGDLRLTTEFAFGANSAGHTRDSIAAKALSRSTIVVDGCFRVREFHLHIDRNLAGQVAASHGGGDFSDAFVPPR